MERFLNYYCSNGKEKFCYQLLSIFMALIITFTF